MKVTIAYNQPIGDFKAIEKRETFYANSFWQPEGSDIVYFRTDRFNVRTVGKSEIVKIEEE